MAKTIVAFFAVIVFVAVVVLMILVQFMKFRKRWEIARLCKPGFYHDKTITVINTTTPIDHQYVYWMSDRRNNSRTTKIGWEHINEYIYGYTYDANGNITEISRRHKTAEI